MPESPETSQARASPSADLLFGTRAHSLVFASGREISSSALFPLLHWGGWLALGAIPFAWTVSSWGFWGALLNNLIWVGSGGLTCLGLRAAYRRARLHTVSYAVIAPGMLLACALFAEVWYIADLIVVRWSFKELTEISGVRDLFTFGASQNAHAPLLIPLAQWFVFCFALLTWSSLYFGINSIMSLELEKARAARALKLADSARLKVLQAQLNPHFLFNALNGVATLIRENKGSIAADMVSTLSEFLRATLRTVNVPEIPVSEELVFIDQYMELQQLRFADRLQVIIEATEETYSALVPTLILQPLVENAVQHGVLTQERGGSVRVSIRRSKEQLLLTVEDDGPGPPKSAAQAFGVGLSNTAERLRTLYGEASAMSIGRSTCGGFVVELRLPFREHTKNAASMTTAGVS